MNAYGRVLLALVVAGGIACGGEGDGGGGDNASPTSPTPTSSGCSRPAAPSNFQAAVTGNNAAFSWSAVSGAIDYDIRVGTGPGSSNVLSTNTTQTTYNWNGINSGTYYARVEARNSCGSGQSSNEVSFRIN